MGQVFSSLVVRRLPRLGLTVVKMGSALQRVNDPCAEKLEVYVRCVEAHKDVAPAEYGGEYCEEEKESYLECRRQNAKPLHKAKA